MAKVALKGTTKIYPGQHIPAVKDITLTVKDKEFLVLLGPSGCGKSTILRMIAGLEEVTEGEIYLDDKLVNRVPPKDRDIAMVFQNYALYPHMSVYKNMAFGLKMRGYPKSQIKQRVIESAQMLGLEDLLDRKPKALSGGERQRVALGRAIVRKPRVFLFDEPLSNLDAKLRVQMRRNLVQLHRRLEATMIYVTHDQVEAMTMGDSIAILFEGRLQQVDDPLNLYDQPANKFVASFIGSPPMNLLPASVKQQPDGLYLKANGLSIKIDKDLRDYLGKEITFGFRPEDIQCTPGGPFKARVESVEPLGSKSNLYLRIGELSLATVTNSHSGLKIGEEIAVDFNRDKIHFFDEGGCRIP
ncbi:MAG: sn-glycerol-3-phosphate ABC transporter ATP-binding protein UgpC [bacterium]